MYVSGNRFSFESRMHQFTNSQRDLNFFLDEGDGYYSGLDLASQKKWDREAFKRKNGFVRNISSPNIPLFNAVTGLEMNMWYWLASSGISVVDGGNTGQYPQVTYLAKSRDLINWTLVQTGAVYREPDLYKNSNLGPISTELCPHYASNTFWAVYNYDPYNYGLPSCNGLAIARSNDFVNWSRHVVLYPFGSGNPSGVMFAATWFTDTDDSDWLVMSYQDKATSFSSSKDFYVMRRLDDSFLNWSTPVKILGTGQLSHWDAAICKINNKYCLYDTSNFFESSSIYGPYTGNGAVDWFVGEAPYIWKSGANFIRANRGVGGLNTMMVFEYSVDNMASWGAMGVGSGVWSGTSVGVSIWHAPGIFYWTGRNSDNVNIR